MLNVKKCVQNCVSKYGLSEEEALRIATTDNILLSIEDLRYKYDNMQMGKDYPDWITPEEHMKMCYATVWRKYNTDYFWFNSCEDVAYDLFVYSSIHLHTYKDKFQLNGLLLCRLKNLTRDYMQEQNNFAIAYDWEDEASTDVEVNNYSQAYKYNAVVKDIENTTELVLTVESIKNDKVKGILLLCGYFLADIQEFLEPLVKFYNSSSTVIQNKIYDLGKDNAQFCSLIQKEVNMKDKSSITVGKVLKVFGKRDKAYLKTDLLPYLKTVGFTNMNFGR